jgi:nucleotide-binding universal stress UspA family protein
VRYRDRVPVPSEVAKEIDRVSSERTRTPSPIVAFLSRGTAGSRALSLVPLGVVVLLAALLFPRRVVPTDVPLPVVDTRELARVEASDHEAATLARNGLSDDARILGTEIRKWNALQTREGTTESEVIAARSRLNEATAKVLTTHPEEIAPLRALQLELFRDAIAELERTGQDTEELHEIAGTFVKNLRAVGWADDRRILPDHTVRGALFKLAWNTTLNLTQGSLGPLSLPEQRALYAFYLTHPHPSESKRTQLAESRKNAKDREACDVLRASEEAATEDWRLEKVKKLGTLDPDYPTSFAMGVVLYRQGRYAASSEAFRDWLREHPDGPLALRAQNHLRAALYADGML